MSAARDLTDLERTLLGLVAISPMSGYDLKKLFSATAMASYSPSSGGLYPALHRLERRGLVVGQVVARDEVRGRRVFAPTSAGLSTLDAWLFAPVVREDVTQRMESVMMRFALMAGRSTRLQVLEFLRQLEETLRAYVADLEAYAEALGPTAGLHQRLSLEHGVAVYRARLAWAESALAEVRAAPTC